MTGRAETMEVHAPGFLTALLAFLSGGGLFTLIIALLKRPLDRAAQRLQEQVQADKVRTEARQGDREEVKLFLENLSARLTQTEARADRQGVKIEELQTQIDELRTDKMVLEQQLAALQLAKATETRRADEAEEKAVQLREKIVLVKEQLRLANEELAARQAARRYGHRTGE